MYLFLYLLCFGVLPTRCLHPSRLLLGPLVGSRTPLHSPNLSDLLEVPSTTRMLLRERVLVKQDLLSCFCSFSLLESIDLLVYKRFHPSWDSSRIKLQLWDKA
jgi:hypothetical protein